MKNEKIIEIEDRKKLPCPKCTSTKKKTEWEDGEFGGVNGAGYDTHGKYYEYALTCDNCGTSFNFHVGNDGIYIKYDIFGKFTIKGYTETSYWKLEEGGSKHMVKLTKKEKEYKPPWSKKEE